ncbi:MAG: signal peptidase I [Streptosporangiaceae bacterium]
MPPPQPGPAPAPQRRQAPTPQSRPAPAPQPRSGRGRHAAGPRPRNQAPGRDSADSGREAVDSGQAGGDSGDAKTHSAGGKRKNFWRELLIIVVAAAVLTLVVKAYVVQVYKIPSGSMENTLLINDRVLVNKLTYHFRSIDRGDVVVFSGQNSWGPDAPPPSSDPVVRLWDDVLSDIGLQSSQTYYIKRVIGLPGDRVACCTDGKVTVNGVPLEESSYIYPGDAPSFPFKAVTVPPGHLWVMGDHRGDSDDSRYHTSDPGGGAIPESEVVGRAFLIIWPPSQMSDLPIPSTFQQAALHAGAAGAAVLTVGGAAASVGGTALSVVAAAPVAGTAGVAGIIGAPLLLLRRRRRSRRLQGAAVPRRGRSRLRESPLPRRRRQDPPRP